MEKIYIMNNIYSLYLILLHETLEKNDAILISRNDFNKEIIERLKVKYNIKLIYEPKNKFLRFINYKVYFSYQLKKYLNSKYKLVMSCDHRLLGQYFLNHGKEYFLIEDGSATYTNRGIKNLKLRNILGLNSQNFGRSKMCKKIYLTGLAPIPEDIKDKVEIINLQELWNKKTKEEKQEILEIFGFNIELINNLKNKSKVIYTQPLSEDGVISEEEKIKLYSKIISNYNKNDLVIKKHPREKTDYKKVFPEIEVLNQNFPAELFSVLNIKFQKAITIFSTAALVNKKIEIDFYGTEIHSKLLKRFGSMESIMKRNAVLNEEYK